MSNLTVSGYSPFPEFEEVPRLSRRALANSGLLGKHAYQRFVNQIPIEHTTCSKVIRFIIKGSLASISIIGSVPLAGVSLDFAGRNIKGYCLAIGNVISVANLNTWSILKVVKDKVLPKSKEGIKLLAAERGCWKNSSEVVIIIASVAIGILCQIPQAYVSYYYDDKKWIFPLLTLLGCSSLPIYSIKLTIDNMLDRKQAKPFEKKLQLLKEFLINRLQCNEKRLLEVSLDERDAYFNELERIKDSDELPLQMNRLLSTLFSKPNRQVQNETCIRKYGRYAVEGAGLALTFSRLAVVAITSYKAIEIFTKNFFACIITTAFIVACNTYLTYKVISNVCISAYDRGINAFQGKKHPSFSFNFYPLTSVIMKVFMVAILAFAWAPLYVVPRDNTSGSFQTFLEVAYIIGGLFVMGNALFESTEDFYEMYSNWKGSADERKYLKFKEDVECFSLMIKRSPLKSFASFANLLSDDLLEECLYEVGHFKRSDLTNYIFEADHEELELSSLTVNMHPLDSDDEYLEIP